MEAIDVILGLIGVGVIFFLWRHSISLGAIGKDIALIRQRAELETSKIEEQLKQVQMHCNHLQSDVTLLEGRAERLSAKLNALSK